jgi:hypothetical protein
MNIPLVAAPVDVQTRNRITTATLLHFAPRNYLSSIVTDHSPLASFGNCTVNLKAGNGWLSVRKLMRDYSVWDSSFAESRDFGSYLYFFLGRPGNWALAKNLAPVPVLQILLGDLLRRVGASGLGLALNVRAQQALSEEFGLIEVRGIDALVGNRAVFWRADDQVVVLRGGYAGPARVTPLPLG